MSAQPAAVAPGEETTIAVTIQGADGAAAMTGGLYVPKPGLGQLRALPGEGLTLNPDASLTHSLPKAAQAGVVTFHFAWRAPAQPGAIRLNAYGLAANGDGTSRGDIAGSTQFQTAFGCTLQEFLPDSDGDGFGNNAFLSGIGCAGQPPAGYVAKGGDCADGDATVHPGAVEVCNHQDDNCDGQVDEGAPPVQMWPDEDGDGYYQKQTGTPVMGCGGVPGYAAVGGDCAPKDPKVHPKAIEICNEIDDNCNGHIDEGLHPQCGIGFCRRESLTCSASDCAPGEPIAEACNGLDEDCDGVIDNGDLCGAGRVCQVGQCVAGSLGDAGIFPNVGSGGAGANNPPGARDAGNGGTGGSAPVDSSSAPPGPQGRTGASGCALADRPRPDRPDPAILIVIVLLFVAFIRGEARQNGTNAARERTNERTNGFGSGSGAVVEVGNCLPVSGAQPKTNDLAGVARPNPIPSGARQGWRRCTRC
jgi:hypothetical protein